MSGFEPTNPWFAQPNPWFAQQVRKQLPRTLSDRLAVFPQGGNFVVIRDVRTYRKFRCRLTDDGKLPDTFIVHLCVVV